MHFFLATSPKISTIPSPAFLSPCPSPLSLLPLVAQGWSRVSCSSRSHHKLPVCMNDSALPAATWPTLKVPPLLCSSATSKVTGRQREAVGWWISNVEGGREWRREEKGNKMTQNLGELLPRADVTSFTQQRRRKKKGRGKFLIHICLSICSSFWVQPCVKTQGCTHELGSQSSEVKNKGIVRRRFFFSPQCTNCTHVYLCLKSSCMN